MSIASTILPSYPELSPWEMDPVPFNLKPPPPQDDMLDTPDFVAATLKHAQSTGMNPLYMWYGTNPLIIFDERMKSASLPFNSHTPPPPLLRACITEDITVLEQICPRGNTPLFKVCIGQDVRLLKVFPDRDWDEEVNPPADLPPAMVRFEREKHAYAHLLHYGICEKGTVPRCYGWFDLSRADVEHICALPGIDKDLAALKTLRRTPKAIILEYFPDAVRLSVTNITLDIADVALRALHTIHSAYVMHKDIHRRNILLLPDNRVIWVDFDSSTCLSEAGSKMRRQDLLGELEEGWGLFYNFLVRVSLLNDRDEQFCLMSFLLAAGQAYRLSALAILKPVDYLHVKGKAVEGEEQSGGSKSSDELEARMERAMREAQEESDEDGILEGSDEEEMASGSGLSEEDEEDSDDDEEVEMQAGSEGESEEEDEDSASLKPPSKKQKLLQNPDYLPEHLFASAFSQNAAAASASSAKSEGKKKRAASALPKKRRRVKQTAKDIVVGSRTIRTLPSSNTQTAAEAPRTLAPPAKMTKFIGRSLNFQISINPNIAVFSPPPSIEVKPFTPFNVELKTAKKGKNQLGLPRQRVTSAARRTALGWSKRSVGKTSTSSDKENVDQNTVIIPSDSLRLSRPRPRGRPTPARKAVPAI